jgi:prepilin signal peptidase PulO-like enzyme (type II secretory pathway)
VRRALTVVPPLAWIRIALVAMAVIDAVLVFSGGLQAPNETLNAATPSFAATELPRLQFVRFEGASMGYGDVFVAGVLGAVLAAEGASRRLQAAAAAAALGVSLVFDLLFAVVDVLPATVPLAIVTLLFGGWRGYAASTAGDGQAGGGDASGPHDGADVRDGRAGGDVTEPTPAAR